jgi:poly(3-hydroxybutyrate) depolymerase
MVFRRLIRGLASLLVLVLLAGCRPESASVAALPALDARLDETSVSGMSSGAYMAGQFQIAHSSVVIGAGLIAGGPYGCAESLYADLMPGPGMAIINVAKAINGCMLAGMKLWGVPNPNQLAERAAALAAQSRIDPIEGVKRDRVFLFSGTQDRTVVPEIVAAAEAFYLALGVPAAQIKYVNNVPAAHAFVTEAKGQPCDRSGAPYIVDCDFDLAGALLQHIYGRLAPPAQKPQGQMLIFDQSEFTEDQADHSMSGEGAVYVPAACRQSSGCRVHIAFHGCGQNRASIGDNFLTDTGFAEWADTNRLVVLFPQASIGPANPQGCWDWWGYTGSEFLTRKSPQIIAVRRMLDRLTAKSIAAARKHATAMRVGPERTSR